MSDCYRDQLAIFVEAPRDASLKLKEWIEYKPTNQINGTSAINFTITAQSSAYVDLKSSVLNVKLRLRNGDGTPLNKDAVVGLMNAPLHSIFRQVDVPCQLIIGLVASAAYMGDYGRSPYYFRDYDCSSVGFYVDGQLYLSKPLRPNYEADQYVDCYRTLTCFRKDIYVTRNDYIPGYCLYVLEIDPYYSFNIKRKGHC